MDDVTSEVLARIQEESAAAVDEPRFVRTCGVGDEIRQGDVYLYPLDTAPAHHEVVRPSLKLAAGEGAGSRHIVEGDAVAYDREYVASPLLGPLLHARSRVLLTHPQHADISLPAGWYEVRFQRDYSGDSIHERPVLD